MLIAILRQRIYTEAYLYDKEIFREIEDFAFCLAEIARRERYQLPENADLVLELEVIPEEDRHNFTDSHGNTCMHHWAYYYVNHEERVLFWLHAYDIIDGQGVFHGIEQVLRVQSWTHISGSHRETVYCSADKISTDQNTRLSRFIGMLHTIVCVSAFSASAYVMYAQEPPLYKGA